MLSGCLQVLGLGDYKDGDGDSGGAGAAGTGASGSGVTGTGKSASGSTSSGGSCTEGQETECYTGDEATKNVGNCKTGLAICQDGQLGECTGDVLPLAEDFTVMGDENCDGFPRADVDAAKGFSGDVSAIYDMGTDAAGNLIIVGFFQPSVNFGPSPSDALIATDENDFFVAKFDPAGNYVWSKRFGNSSNEIFIKTAVTPDGHIWLAGVYKNTITFGPTTLNAVGSSDAFVALLDGDGSPLRAVSFDFGQASATSAIDIAALPGGDAIIGGNFDTAINLGGSNNFVTTGNAVYVARLSAATLSTVWARKYGDGDPAFGHADGDEVLSAIATDAGGNTVAIGTFDASMDSHSHGTFDTQGGHDGFVLRFDDSGAETAFVRAAGSGDVSLDSLAADGLGAFTIVGWFDGALKLFDSDQTPVNLATGGALDADLLIWKLTSAGKHAWSARVGDSTSQTGGGTALPFPGSVAATAAGEIVWTGGFYGSAKFGAINLTSAGDEDAFVAVYNPDGTAVWAKSFGDTAPYQTSTALVTLDEHRFAAGFVNTGVIDFGLGPMSPTSPDPFQFILTRFFL